MFSQAKNYSACSETSDTDPIFHLMRDLKSVIIVLNIKTQHTGQECTHKIQAIMYVYMLWFNFILVLNFISLCFKLILSYIKTKSNKI